MNGICVGARVRILAKDAYGKRTRRGGEMGWVVSTSAGVIPGLYTMVVRRKRDRDDRRKWLAIHDTALQRIWSVPLWLGAVLRNHR